MTDRQITNVAASVRQKLRNLARARGEAFEYLLSRYGTERLLYRISQSPYVHQFILKGAVLFQLWSDQPHRPTRDVDLLGFGEPSPQRIAIMLQEICAIDVPDDGLTFDQKSIQVEQIKTEDAYQGIRARLVASLVNARVPLQVDIGFGDAIHPQPEEIDYPTLLNHAVPRLKSYPRETVVAEKFQALVLLGMTNSRMKDFFDLWILAQEFEFDGPLLAGAMRATFERRGTNVPATAPLALTAEFSADTAKAKQWSAFLSRGNLQPAHLRLPDVLEFLHGFLLPPAVAIHNNQDFPQHWVPTGPWSPDEAQLDPAQQ